MVAGASALIGMVLKPTVVVAVIAWKKAASVRSPAGRAAMPGSKIIRRTVPKTENANVVTRMTRVEKARPLRWRVRFSHRSEDEEADRAEIGQRGDREVDPDIGAEAFKTVREEAEARGAESRDAVEDGVPDRALDACAGKLDPEDQRADQLRKQGEGGEFEHEAAEIETGRKVEAADEGVALRE